MLTVTSAALATTNPGNTVTTTSDVSTLSLDRIATVIALQSPDVAQQQNFVTICHTPPPEDITLQVPPPAVSAHLGHGDYLGPCDDGSGPGENPPGDTGPIDGNQHPTAAFDVTPETAARAQQVTVNASPSNDPDGDITAYHWDLDDDGSYEAKGPTATTAFFQEGRHRIRLRVEDDAGATDTTSDYVEVTDTVNVTGTAFEHKIAAYRLLNRSESLVVEEENLTRTLRESFQYFIHPNRITNQSVFEREQEVAGPMQTRNRSVTDELATADRLLAFVAIQDAKQTQMVLEKRGYGVRRGDVRGASAGGRRSFRAWSSVP